MTKNRTRFSRSLIAAATFHALVVIAPFSAARAEAPAGADDPVSDLLRVLDQETALATRSKLNIDFVPGMVTVLHGTDLRAKGVHTVFEAMGLVPGFELSMAGDGQLQFLVRGLGKTFASTKIKFLLNGVDMNSSLGSNIAVHTIPIEQVERIEVIRGPGSAIHGEYALAGVVDIITVEQQSDVFARRGDVAGTTVGGSYDYRPQDSKFGFSLSASGANGAGGEVESERDKLFGTPAQGLSNAPGLSNEHERNRAAILKLHYAENVLIAQHVSSGYGDHFGVNDVLPERHDDIVRLWTLNVVEARAPRQFGPDAQGELRASWTRFVGDADNQQLLPRGYHNEFRAIGVVGDPHYEETRASVQTSLEYAIGDAHRLLVGAELTQIRQGDTWTRRNFDPDRLNTVPHPPGPIEVPYDKYTGEDNWLEEDLRRRIVSGYIQDQYRGIERLGVTVGWRVDRYDDVGESVTPRIAAVYQLTDHQTLKLQHSDSFRPPSFLEMYLRNNPIVNGNPDIRPETLHNVELGYVYNDGNHVLRLTAFTSRVEDVIVVDGATRRYRNGGDARFDGAELELVVPVTRRAKFDGNVTYIQADAQDDVGTPWGAADVLANAGLLYQFMTDRFVNVQYRYVGDRARSDDDARADLDGYRTLDVAVSLDHLWTRGLTLRAGVKNIFDDDVVYPAPARTTPDDYPRPGRNWWVAAAYRF